MNLHETLQAVRDESLNLTQLEKYRDTLIHFKTDLLKAVAELEKQEALFLMREPEKSAAARKMEWKATEAGQKLIEYKANLRGLPSEIDALMSRIFSQIR